MDAGLLAVMAGVLATTQAVAASPPMQRTNCAIRSRRYAHKPKRRSARQAKLPLAKIAASATRLSRLVNQLLAPGGTVELEAPTVASGAKVELQVVDAGPGVPDALRVLVEFGSAMAGEEGAE